MAQYLKNETLLINRLLSVNDLKTPVWKKNAIINFAAYSKKNDEKEINNFEHCW